MFKCYVLDFGALLRNGPVMSNSEVIDCNAEHTLNQNNSI